MEYCHFTEDARNQEAEDRRQQTLDRELKAIKRQQTLDAIKEAWNKYPDLRLCQLLGNCFERHDLYYVTDSDLKKALKEI